MPTFVNGIQMYLVCLNCGEAFDSMEPAVGHDGQDDDGQPCYGIDTNPLYRVVDENEAM